MATPITKKRRQVVLKRDADGNVVYDVHTGKPLVAKTIRKSRRAKGSFAQATSKSGGVTVRELTPDERKYHSKRTRKRRCAVPPVENPTFSPFSRRRSSSVSK
jgi:hypothetical protein